MAKKQKTGKQERTFEVEVREINEEARTVEISFSSELPYTRWFGTEILSHNEKDIHLDRLKEVGSVLFSHGRDPNYGQMPIGKFEKIWLEDNKGKAIIGFDDDDDSDKVFKKVKSGSLKGISVGYIVHSWEDVGAGKKSKDGKFTGPVSIARDWEPIEISFVATPADPDVGVGREEEAEEKREMEEKAEIEKKIKANQEWFERLRKKIGGIENER